MMNFFSTKTKLETKNYVLLVALKIVFVKCFSIFLKENINVMIILTI